jgi:phosphoenolpyruvate-protein phosphotransferase
VNSERQRLDHSVTATIDELKRLRDRTTTEIGAEQAAIFRVQLAILRDPYFAHTVEEHIACHRRTAEHALVSVVDDWVNGAAALTDEHSREQAMDVRDLAQRVMSHLSGRSGVPFAPPPKNSILVASELLPSDVMELDWSGVLAAVTERGGPTSHASILVRSLGIPAVTGLTGIRDLSHQGEELLVNGELGVVFLEPSVEETVLFGSQRAHYQQVVKSLAENEAEPCTTLDGVQVSLYANISSVSEVADVIAHHMDGVALLRTELLFGSDEPPSLVDQYEAYRTAAEALSGRSLVVRTFDFGGDKIPRFLEPWSDANPTLSLRGLEFALQQNHLLRTQLLAIMDAAQHYDIRLLFPMVMGSDDLCAAVELVRDVAEKHGLPMPKVGAMIETPSALFALDEIMPHVDFVSLGTNDLAHLMLGTDRDAAELSEEYAAVYPTILRAIRRVVEAADKARRPLTVCGEMAGHPTIARLLVGLGIRELSMSPARCMRVHHALRHLDGKEAEAIAKQALQCHSRREVRQLLAVWRTDDSPDGLRLDDDVSICS